MEIQNNIALKPLTWMKVGGPADYYAEVRTKDELQEAYAFAQEKNLPILYIGQGSNMILPDEGIRGLVIRLMNKDFEIYMNHSEDNALLSVEAGMILAKLIRECRKQRLNGLDNFVGIPGVMGAALSGNIGIPEEEIGELVTEVEIFDGKEFRVMTPEECEFRYRDSKIKDEYWLVWSMKLLIRKGDPPHKDDWLLERVAKQPKGHSCGSFFKNPDPENALYAGKLIDEAGLKGKYIGGALISELHGNFLMNDGTGTATEILELARQVKQEILDKKGVLLENEVLVYDQFCQLVQI
jgi:UDP-N-acetylenolpyruvoylglucosamine reductase